MEFAENINDIEYVDIDFEVNPDQLDALLNISQAVRVKHIESVDGNSVTMKIIELE